MEMWGLFDEMFSSKDKKVGKPQKMGPTHPAWKYRREEVEILLKQAGRIYDEETIEAIALDGTAQDALSLEALENMELRSQQLKYEAMAKTIAAGRKESDQ